MIQRAVERGDIPSSIDIDTVVEVFPSIACQRAVTHGLQLHETDVVRIVDSVLLPALSHR